MSRSIEGEAIAQLFTRARTPSAWSSTPIEMATLKQLYELAKLGPTSANCQPMRLAFVTTSAAKEQLLLALSRGNVKKAASAPAIAIVAQDRNYLDRLPELYPVGYDARSWFNTSPDAVAGHGERNTMLQAAYLIMAARALGIDCGPMSGFDRDAINKIFFPDQSWDAKLLIGLGFAAEPVREPRKPRLRVEDACRFI
ncbi:malonic semialdehyde reductase [Bradyrhizobium manausense]|uniref:Malonic semialdehyde reductase n=1 Tax=Bradyrhizobium manausense TaxID=989370 RepID=A0A0R3E8W0_9BRAD|nr:malonic semialdehyde reductase [Bradyrhizobium manausense]